MTRSVLPELSPEVPATVLADSRPTPTHCGITLTNLYGWLLPTLLPMVLAGAMFMGFRALAALGVTIVAGVVGAALWKLVGQRGRGIHLSHALYMAALLGLLMPAELARGTGEGIIGGAGVGWPVLVAAGLTLAAVLWLLGGVGARVHPVAVTFLLMVAVFQGGELSPERALVRPYLFTGDVLQSRTVTRDVLATSDPVLFAVPDEAGVWGGRGGGDVMAIRTEPKGSAAAVLSNFTRGDPERKISWLSLDGLLRDQLPPLEDLILGGHPAPLGLASLVGVLLGGLLLLYRGGADWRVPAFTVLGAFAGFLCLRIPVVVGTSVSPEGTVGNVWRWAAFYDSQVSVSTLVTFASYQIAAGPLVFMAFFLATSGATAPYTRRARTIYAMVLGVLSAACQLYVSVAVGPLLALLAVSLVLMLVRDFNRAKPVF